MIFGYGRVLPVGQIHQARCSPQYQPWEGDQEVRIAPRSVNDFATAKLLTNFGVDPKSVQYVNGGRPEFPTLLARGGIDGYVICEPWTTNRIKAGGHLLLTSGEFDFVYLLIVAKGAWLIGHRDESEAVVTAVAQACDMSTVDPTKAGGVTQAEIKIPSARAVDLLKNMSCKVRAITAEDVDNYGRIACFLAERKIAKVPADVDTFRGRDSTHP